MEEDTSASARKRRRRRSIQKSSSLTKNEMDAALLLVQLGNLKEEESEGESYGDVSSYNSSEIEKILRSCEKLSGRRRKANSRSSSVDVNQILEHLFDENGPQREIQYQSNTTKPEMNAAQQLLDLSGNSENYKCQKAKGGEESNSDTSHITDASSSPMETQLEEVNTAQRQMLQLHRNSDKEDEQSEGERSHLSCVLGEEGNFTRAYSFCPRKKKKLRPLADLYRITTPENIAVSP